MRVFYGGELMSTQTTITLNGVQRLTQWDTDRTVSVTGNVPIVHFSNDSTEAIPIAVKNGLAAIPNILLQDSVPITAWAFVVTENGGYTQHHIQFEVSAKPRPLDYIYTETETANIALVLECIGELSSLTTSNKTSLVAAINEISTKSGVVNHSDLEGRNLPNQHSISAINGLEDALGVLSKGDNEIKSELNTTKAMLQKDIADKQPKGDYLTKDDVVDEAIDGSNNAITSGAVYRLLVNSEQLVDEIYEIVGGVS